MNVDLFKSQFGIDVEDLHGETVQKYIDLKRLERKGPFLRLTRKGLMVANAICAEFM